MSNIVATVLIILLALAAVAIVWGFLRPTFENAASSTTLRSACLSIDLEVTKCTLSTASGVTTATVAYRLNSGDAGLISNVIVVVEDANRETIVNGGDKPGSTLESKTLPVDVGSAVGPFRAKVAANVTDGTNIQVCSESTAVVCGQ